MARRENGDSTRTDEIVNAPDLGTIKVEFRIACIVKNPLSVKNQIVVFSSANIYLRSVASADVRKKDKGILAPVKFAQSCLTGSRRACEYYSTVTDNRYLCSTD